MDNIHFASLDEDRTERDLSDILLLESVGHPNDKWDKPPHRSIEFWDRPRLVDQALRLRKAARPTAPSEPSVAAVNICGLNAHGTGLVKWIKIPHPIS